MRVRHDNGRTSLLLLLFKSNLSASGEGARVGLTSLKF